MAVPRLLSLSHLSSHGYVGVVSLVQLAQLLPGEPGDCRVALYGARPLPDLVPFAWHLSLSPENVSSLALGSALLLPCRSDHSTGSVFFSVFVAPSPDVDYLYGACAGIYGIKKVILSCSLYRHRCKLPPPVLAGLGVGVCSVGQ